MTKPFTVSLKGGERLYVNGAVLRVDRKVSIEFLNDVTFLLENHVMKPEDTSTPLRQLYFVVQSMILDPANAHSARMMFETSYGLMLSSFANEDVRTGLNSVRALVQRERVFEALKMLRGLFAIEDAILDTARLERGAEGAKNREMQTWT